MTRYPAWLLGGWLWLVGLGWPSHLLASPPPLQLDVSLDRQGFQGHLSYLKDPSGTLSFEQVRVAAASGQFQAVIGDAVPSGYLGNKPLWIHFSVDYPAGDHSIWWLLMVPELLDTITVYAEQADGQFMAHEGGRSLPFAQREMEGIGHAFRLGVEHGGVRHYFVRATLNAAIKVEPTLWKEKPLYGFLSRVNAALGAYVGLVGLLILLAFSRAFTYRNPWDFAHLAYLVGFELFHLTNTGVVQA